MEPPSVVRIHSRYGWLAPFGLSGASHWLVSSTPFVAPWPSQVIVLDPVVPGLPPEGKAKAVPALISVTALTAATNVADRRRIASFIALPMASLARGGR